MKTYPTPVKVDKANYEVFSFASGYYGISEKSRHSGNCIAGGDSANEDDYSEEYINDVYKQWDGTLYYSVNYGYLIAQ